MEPAAEVATLLQQTSWVRALARSLVADAHLADDLVQDAWVTALGRPPATDRPVRGWLATVLRHRAREVRREGGRRERRELESARPEALPSAHDVVEKAALQRTLVEAVLELDEPYRTTVLLRFFEELPQREIARRMQTTTATVNSRLTRALEKLRERLSRGGGSTAWLAALVPLLREPALGPAAAFGVSAMKLGVSVVVAASVLAGVVLWRTTQAPERVERPVLALAPAAPAALEPASAPAPIPAERLPAEVSRPEVQVECGAPAEPPVASAPPRILRGRVLDAGGVALPGVELALATRERAGAAGAPIQGARCTSGPGGWFEIPAHAAAGTIVCADPRFATVLAGSAEVLGDAEPLVVVAPLVRIAGAVIDENGTPLGGARLEIRLPDGFGADWGMVPDFTDPQRWIAQSGADGRFELAAVPVVRDAELRATLGGYQEHAEPAPTHSNTRLEVVLSRPRSDAGLLQGVVLDPRGAPVEGARVSARSEVAYTGRDGEFTLDLTRPGTRAPLIALKRGFVPAELDPPLDAEGRPDWPSSVVLRLGPPPSSIRGRVVDDDGQPVGGARVWLDDPTPFGQMGHDSVAAESLLRGDERFWSFEVTEPDGTFRIDGLLPRTYRLQAIDPVLLADGELGPLAAADSPVEIVLRTHDVHPRVAGRVVTRAGDPVAGVSVSLLRITYEVKLEHGKQNDGVERPPVLTDEDGAFEFLKVPKGEIGVLVQGDEILFTGTRLEMESDVEDIVLHATRRLHLQVELDAPHERADRMRVLDASGKPVVQHVMQAEGAYFHTEMKLVDGRSEVITVDDDAATLVLLRGEDEVVRIPLHLAPGETNVVRH